MTAVLYEKRGKIAYVTINRPEAMNALNRDVQQGLTDAWQEIEADSYAADAGSAVSKAKKLLGIS